MDQSNTVDLIILEEEDLVDLISIFIGFRDSIILN